MAEVTGLDVAYIWEKLPLAVGRQYEQIFYAKHEVIFEAILDSDSRVEDRGLQTVV